MTKLFIAQLFKVKKKESLKFQIDSHTQLMIGLFLSQNKDKLPKKLKRILTMQLSLTMTMLNGMR